MKCMWSECSVSNVTIHLSQNTKHGLGSSLLAPYLILTLLILHQDVILYTTVSSSPQVPRVNLEYERC